MTEREKSVKTIACFIVCKDITDLFIKIFMGFSYGVLPFIDTFIFLFVITGFKVKIYIGGIPPGIVWIFWIITVSLCEIPIVVLLSDNQSEKGLKRVALFFWIVFFTPFISQLIGCIFYPIFVGKPIFSTINFNTGISGLGLLTILCTILILLYYLYKHYRKVVGRIQNEPPPPYSV